MAECEQIAKLRSSKLLSSSTRHQLDDYSCDYNKKPSKVCCPPGPLTLTEEVPPPPDVSAHPNLHLLPKDCAIITTDFKIRNGIKADLNEFPYMALLSFNLFFQLKILYNGEYFQQHEETAMGNSLSPFIANLFMSKFETEVKDKFEYFYYIIIYYYFPRVWFSTSRKRQIENIAAVCVSVCRKTRGSQFLALHKNSAFNLANFASGLGPAPVQDPTHPGVQTTGPAFKCGGTVINERYILTAAHCVVTKDPLLGVRVGEYNLASRIDCSDPSDPDTCNPPVQDLAIEKAIIPEDYNITDHANDIALLRVTKMDFSEDYVQPVCLPVEEKTRNHEVTSGAATGWGYIDPELTDSVKDFAKSSRARTAIGEDKALDIFLSVRENIIQFSRVLATTFDVSHHDYISRYTPEGDVGRQTAESLRKSSSVFNNLQTDVHRRATQEGLCSGDSGGPFQVPLGLRGEGRFVQFGIVSAGPQYCGYTGAPGIYTKIVYYMDWILDNLEP
ncbi:hypothetical protein NQ318_004008 [Aromia moschata]|uniref:Peptidase S1 domain-containing protein n=1 Tax=Aromia moschata TaxID=1265417 RepID=A0AAV8ZAU0_9CUCU|nr:hypothetical protein NQ318_004008 [Aromia moschata]